VVILEEKIKGIMTCEPEFFFESLHVHYSCIEVVNFSRIDKREIVQEEFNSLFCRTRITDEQMSCWLELH